MREILFRGKCKETKVWYIGYYINLHRTTYCFKEDYDNDKNNDIHHIVFEQMTDWGLPNRHLRVDIIPETIGQYTGLTDKNGKRIFEGDIVKFKTSAYYFKNCRIEYQSCYGRYCAIDNHGYEYPMDKTFEYEVIGNIHDNPELLKGVEQ